MGALRFILGHSGGTCSLSHKNKVTQKNRHI